MDSVFCNSRQRRNVIINLHNTSLPRKACYLNRHLVATVLHHRNGNGGCITAQGGSDAAGIGSPWYATCGNILITGENTVVTAKAGSNRAANIRAGPDNGRCDTVIIKAGATMNGTKYAADHEGQIW